MSDSNFIYHSNTMFIQYVRSRPFQHKNETSAEQRHRLMHNDNEWLHSEKLNVSMQSNNDDGTCRHKFLWQALD